MRRTTESILSVLIKGIVGLLLAMLLAYCIIAIAAGDGCYGLIELMWNV